MGLKALLGDDYRDDLTVEEINQLLQDREFVDKTNEPPTVSKELLDRKLSELAKVKKELRELREKSMTDEERLQAELLKAQETQEAYLLELSRLRAKEVFVEAGLKEEEYSTVLDMVVSSDEDVTKARAKSMVELINNQKKAVEKAVKADLLKDTPKPPAGTPEGGMTKEQFQKLNLLEKQEFARKNPDIYQRFYKEE